MLSSFAIFRSQQEFPTHMQESSLLADGLSDVSLSSDGESLPHSGPAGPPTRIRTMQAAAESASPKQVASEGKGPEAGSSINVSAHLVAEKRCGPLLVGEEQTAAEQVHEVDLLGPDALPKENVSVMSDTKSESL